MTSGSLMHFLNKAKLTKNTISEKVSKAGAVLKDQLQNTLSTRCHYATVLVVMVALDVAEMVPANSLSTQVRCFADQESCIWGLFIFFYDYLNSVQIVVFNNMTILYGIM